MSDDDRGRCIVCGLEHTVDRTRAVSEETGQSVPASAPGPNWQHRDGIEATVCDACHADPERIVTAHRLLTLTGAVVAA